MVFETHDHNDLVHGNNIKKNEESVMKDVPMVSASLTIDIRCTSSSMWIVMRIDNNLYMCIFPHCPVDCEWIYQTANSFSGGKWMGKEGVSF